MMNTRSFTLLPLAMFLSSGFVAADEFDAGANRLTYLDEDNPYHVSHEFPKLTTPMWVGEPGVECVVIMSIDDMREPNHKNNSDKYEAFLRPVLERLKKIDGRAPLSIFTCTAAADDPNIERWLEEGLSIEVHTTKHPCPLLRDGDLDWGRGLVHDCIDMLDGIPGARPVAYRAPCCDVFNTQSPLIFSEILTPPTADGGFLTMDSSVHHFFTKEDPEMPRELALDEEGRTRFAKYATGEVPMAGRLNYKYANFVENYPYPYVVNGNLWEIVCHTPGDHQAFFFEKLYGRRFIADWKAGVDAAAVKRGLVTVLFHPYGKCSPEELIELIDHATETYGKKVKFLSLRDVEERLTANLLAGNALRAPGDGGDNGVRLLDVDNDGFIDVVIANEKKQVTRLWSPGEQTWKTTGFPTILTQAGVRFGVLDADGLPTVLVRNSETSGAWKFDGGKWVARAEFFKGLEIDGRPVHTAGEGGRDRGVRLRDIDGNGSCELLVANDSENAVFSWSTSAMSWERRGYGLPAGCAIVDAAGRDAGLRFVDVDGDGLGDVVFSNEKGYAVHAFVSAAKGWARVVAEGIEPEGGDAERAIPAIVRGGRGNGAFLNAGRIWFTNEHTDKLSNHAMSAELSRLGKP